MVSSVRAGFVEDRCSPQAAEIVGTVVPRPVVNLLHVADSLRQDVEQIGVVGTSAAVTWQDKSTQFHSVVDIASVAACKSLS